MKTQHLAAHYPDAMMICEGEAILEELLADVEFEDFHFQRLGPRAIVAPSYELTRLKSALQARGVYPKIVGQPAELPEEEEPTPEDTPTTEEQTSKKTQDTST